MLLVNVYDCLSDDGWGEGIVLIRGLFNDDKTDPIPQLWWVAMVIDQPEGKNYSFSEVSKMLSDIGFTT